MEQPPCDDIIITYDDNGQSYYCIWRPLTSVGLGKTEEEALDDLRAAAHFSIETMVGLKLREIGKTAAKGEGCNRQKSVRRSHIGRG
jgi:predicted RNase H-like HicB family nuclease